MVTNKVSEAAETAKKHASSTPVGAEFAARRARRRTRTCGELASVGSLGANIVTTSTRTPNYRAPASGGTIGELAIESDAPAPDTDRDPPTSGVNHAPRSALLFRVSDGALLMSLEDADDRDVSGRVVVPCLLLNERERAAFQVASDDAAGIIIGKLPRRST